MSNFVKFFAIGYINQNGTRTAVTKGNGVVRDTCEIMGKIFQQCPQLLPCDSISVKTYRI